MRNSSDKEANVVELLAFKRVRAGDYCVGELSVLKRLDPVVDRGCTISGGNLTESQTEVFLQTLADNRDLWMIEVTNVAGEKTKIFRGDLPPDRWPHGR